VTVVTMALVVAASAGWILAALFAILAHVNDWSEKYWHKKWDEAITREYALQGVLRDERKAHESFRVDVLDAISSIPGMSADWVTKEDEEDE
jgi:hypothetical protein